MNAQVSFLDGEFSLIHIPRHLYSVFLEPILRILLPQQESSEAGLDNAGGFQGLTADHRHVLLNVSVTPIECSIVCHQSWVERVFRPFLDAALPADLRRAVGISPHPYIALCVVSAGIDAGSRVVDLTSPLALAGIPIFFITTYFCDFILVPRKNRDSVIQALGTRGFVFSEADSSFTSPVMMASVRGRGPTTTMGGAGGGSSAPSTPPSSSSASAAISDLQDRTFELLKRQSVAPEARRSLHLVHCSGHEMHHVGGEISSLRPSLSRAHTGSGGGGGNGGGYRRPEPTWIDNIDPKLFACLVAALASQPAFLSVTLSAEDPPSLLLDRALLPLFGDAVVGDTETDLVPIFLDLGGLPPETTGIVSGVAGRLVREMEAADTVELLYLSTARAGTVILSQDRVEAAVGVLRPLQDKV
ncbi:uncharacterized protein E0L32_008658 [Thyridium curvatum]|uniref:CASTOR ACT domain-containing protein n=1 Tax=Thyridium curvatum TaxID=1093900 RepID=A0A507AZK2_9PEZI|nr:uncharacterized protein E0L32_008658 [Thyridium curvatum]TPX10439.1 hypothetical protein E0L32_008658 [Thyridium curvatum]